MPAMYHSICFALPLMWCLGPKSRCVKTMVDHTEKAEVEVFCS